MSVSALRTLALGTFLGIAPRGRLATPAPLRWPNKQPGETLDFSLDLAAVLADDGADGINTALASVTPLVYGGLAVGEAVISAPLVTFMISGGASDTDYVVAVSITLASGRVLNPAVGLYVAPPAQPEAAPVVSAAAPAWPYLGAGGAYCG